MDRNGNLRLGGLGSAEPDGHQHLDRRWDKSCRDQLVAKIVEAPKLSGQVPRLDRGQRCHEWQGGERNQQPKGNPLPSNGFHSGARRGRLSIQKYYRPTACRSQRCTSNSSAAGIGAGPPASMAARKALQQATWPLSWERRRRVRKPGRPQAWSLR